MEKYDLKKARKEYTASAKDFALVDVPPLRCIAVDGEGDPNTAAAYTGAVEALYATAYTLKFASRKDLGRDFVVGPLEGLWRADDPSAFVQRRKDSWSWTMLIAQPDWITADHVRDAVEAAGGKRPNPALERLGVRDLHEGRSVQILHIGPYDAEGPVLARLHDEYMPEHGLAFNGDHHEVYLGDPRRSGPERLRTILRQPVRPR